MSNTNLYKTITNQTPLYCKHKASPKPKLKIINRITQRKVSIIRRKTRITPQKTDNRKYFISRFRLKDKQFRTITLILKRV